MDLQIILLLGQDGLTSGAIYALLALSIVLVFSITRVLLVPQGARRRSPSQTYGARPSFSCWL